MISAIALPKILYRKNPAMLRGACGTQFNTEGEENTEGTEYRKDRGHEE
jgi:hypothetical protein